MEYMIAHETTYRYPEPASESYTVVHLQPRTNLRQYCTRYALEVTPSTRVFSYVDRFGNDVQHFTIVPEHDELRIVARSQVVTVPAPPLVASPVDAAILETDPLLNELYDYRHETPYVPLGDAVHALAAEINAPREDLAAYVLAAGRFVYRTFAYRPGSTTVCTHLSEVIAARSGVCQDFAHVLLALIRVRGIPGRYASGYIYSGSRDMLGAEASHAWVEAYLPPLGWVGYDPTNDRIVDDGFVLVAHGRDYGDVSPTRGVYRGRARGTLDVNVAIGAQQQ